MMGGQEMTYRNVNNTRLGAEADLSLVCYSINYQLTFLLFQESVSTGLLTG